MTRNGSLLRWRLVVTISCLPLSFLLLLDDYAGTRVVLVCGCLGKRMRIIGGPSGANVDTDSGHHMLVAHISNSLIHLGALWRCNLQVTTRRSLSHDGIVAELETTLILHHHQVVEGIDAEGGARASRPIRQCIHLVTAARIRANQDHLRNDLRGTEGFSLMRIERSELAATHERRALLIAASLVVHRVRLGVEAGCCALLANPASLALTKVRVVETIELKSLVACNSAVAACSLLRRITV